MTTKILFLLGSMLLIGACTPKTAQQTTDTKPQPTTPTKPAGTKKEGCATFDNAKNPDQALENFVLYRDFIKAEDWNTAFDYWKKVYAEAPAADGKRSTVFTDGIRFYERFIAQDSSRKEEYFSEILKLYDAMEKCYPEGGYVTGLKAFDYFFKYPDRKTKMEQYEMFKKSIELDEGKPRYFVLNPFTALLVDLTLEEKIPLAEAQKYQKIIRDAIDQGLKDCQKNKDCDSWNIINEYAPARLEALESIEGFYDCVYYKQKYFPEFEANRKDCEVITTTYSRLRWGKCPDADTQFESLKAAYLENCYEAPTSPTATCNDALREGKYRQAVTCFTESLKNISDAKTKAEFNLLIAKIYYAYLKDFPRARQYALDAARLRPNWGQPYLLIGTLYASSGPICGPGRGWDSQIVVWPAIDMWQKAKSVDPGVAAEANKLIAQYAQYMPGKEDIFQRTLSEGASFYVGCWIQETTTIRAAK